MSTKLFLILYIICRRAWCGRSCSEDQPSWSSMVVTLLVLLKSLSHDKAELSWAALDLLYFFVFRCIWGSHEEAANSTVDRMNVVYTASLTFWLVWHRLREKKALVQFAFLVMESTWLLKFSFGSRCTPRYLAELTVSKTWPWMVYAAGMGCACW